MSSSNIQLFGIKIPVMRQESLVISGVDEEIKFTKTQQSEEIQVEKIFPNNAQKSNIFQKQVRYLNKSSSLNQVKGLMDRFNSMNQSLVKGLSQKKEKFRHQKTNFYKIKIFNQISQFENLTDPRSIYFRVSFGEITSDKLQNTQDLKSLIQEWLGIVYRSTASISWSMYFNKKLTFEETKILFTSNIIYNYIQLMKEVRKISVLKVDNLQVTKLFNEGSIKVMGFLCFQYPLTRISAPNLALREQIPQIDEKGKIQFQLVSKFKIPFRYRQDKNYTYQIMSFINYIIDSMDSNFSEFQKYLSKFFNEAIYQKRQYRQSSFELGQNQFREKVKKYTTILIDRKLPANTPKYTKQQIINGIFFIKSPQILRILSKWVQQLHEYIQNPHQKILNCFFPFKNHNGEQCNVQYQIKRAITEAMEKNSHNLNQKMKKIRQQCYLMEGLLTKEHHIKYHEALYLNQDQVSVGLFCAKLKEGLSSYLYFQLNQLIHFLLKIPLMINEKKISEESYYQRKARRELDNINLITFTVYDLLRCRCISGQKEIIDVISGIKEKSEDIEQKFNLVRVKDRLDQTTRDVLINCQINQWPVCQIQLSITTKTDAKQQMLSDFSHFFYQIERAHILGPLIECVSIWATLSQKYIYFRKMNKKIMKEAATIEYKSNGELQQIIQFPIVCKSCKIFYPTQRTCLKNWVFKLNSDFPDHICGECRYLGLSKMLKKKQIFGNQFPEQFLEHVFECQKFDPQNFPEFAFFTKKNYFQPQIRFLSKSKTNQGNTYQIFETLISRQKKSIIPHNYFPQLMESFKDIKPQMIVYFINKQYLEENMEYISINCLRDKIEAQENINLINLLYIRNSFSPTKIIKSKKLQQQLLKELQDFFPNQTSLKIIILKIPNTNFIILCQVLIDEKSIGEKLKKRQNLQAIKRFALSKSSIINLEFKKVSYQFCENYIVNNLGPKLFQNLCENISKVYLNFGNITEIGDLSYLKKVEVLFISHNKLHSLKGIEGMIQLQWINFDKNQIKTLNQLTKLQRLKYIEGNDNKIEALDGLQNLKQLEQLSIANNLVKMIRKQDFGLLNKLKVLNMRGNKLEHFSSFQGLQNIQDISFSNNPLQSINNLKSFSSLKALSLSQLKLTKIPCQYLEGLELTELKLNYNLIKQMTGIQSQIELRVLQLKYNLIENITGLGQLKKLQKILLDNNKITSLDGLLVVASLKQYSIKNNNIDLPKNIFSSIKLLPRLKYQ